MDPTWEFQAPQFVDFNNLGPAEDTSADEFFNVDMESGEKWVTAVEDMDQGAPDSPLPHTTRNDTTFQVTAPIPIPPPAVSIKLPSRKPSNMVTSWGPGHVIKTFGTGVNHTRDQVKRNDLGKGGYMRKVGTPKRAAFKAAVTTTLRGGRNTPRNLHRTPRRPGVGTSRQGAGTPKRLGTNCLEPRLAVLRPRTQVQRSLNTPTASRTRRKSKSPSIPVPFPLTPEVVKRFKNKLLGADLQPRQPQHSKPQPTKFKSQAEQILSYQRSTPSRFRSRPQLTDQAARARVGSVQSATAQPQSARPRLATVPKTPKLATKARCMNKRKATVVETLTETAKNKIVPASATGLGSTRLAITVPQPFKLSTQLRAGEREYFELTKRRKEAAAEEKRRLDDERKEKEEQEELVKVRKGLVHRAQPVRNYKPLEIKRSDKQLTMPASIHLGHARGANC